MSSRSKFKVSSRRPQKSQPTVLQPDTYQIDDDVYCPQDETSFRLLISVRVTAALWCNISDCDEVYNYWEPLHYLLFGTGFQTWEYSPIYAIRSYFYLWVNGCALIPFVKWIPTSRVAMFYMVRCILAILAGVADMYLYKGIKEGLNKNVARIFLCFALFSAGCFTSSVAFLPSSFAMYCVNLSFGAWLHGEPHLAILCIACGAILGWPFVAILGVPLVLQLLYEKQLTMIVKYCLISLGVFLLPLCLVDSFYFGKFVVSPINIILYNVFSDHGPNLYGTEPWIYYLFNGFLNFNFAFLLALSSLPILLFTKLFFRRSWNNKRIIDWLIVAAPYLWFVVFWVQPHKEERFLFPIYGLICLNAAIALEQMKQIIHFLAHKRSTRQLFDYCVLVVCVLIAMIGVSRIAQVYRGFTAPVNIYSHLTEVATNDHDDELKKPVNLCVGKEWHRFPSSFFLPDEWKLQFIKSAFKGQLPKPYEGVDFATRLIPSHMNDLNLEEPSRYIDIAKCDYLVDFDVDTGSPLEPRYTQIDDWTTVTYTHMLDSRMSRQPFRSFYVPFLFEDRITFANYTLLRRNKKKKR